MSKKHFFILFSLGVMLTATTTAKDVYNGYQVLSTEPLTDIQATVLGNLQELSFDFWKDPVIGREAEIMASKGDLEVLKKILSEHNIAYTIKIEDVQRLINENKSKKKGQPKNKQANSRYALDWNDYYGHNDINEFIDELAETYDYVSTVSIGQTFEGRDMRAIQITKAGEGKQNIFVEGGIHAREWISNAVVTYTISELVENYDAHPQYLDNFNFYIIPMANPDGYEYSRSDFRLWRKNRVVTDSTLGCMGVDLNRNYDFHWGESGVSEAPCGEMYPGESPFSELEARNTRDFFLSVNPRPEIAIVFHSYGPLWLWPYGYAYDAYPPNWEEIKDMADSAVIAVNAVHNQSYVSQNSAALYPAAGCSDEWMKDQGSRFTFTVELRDDGFGFLLPPDRIIPTGEEAWAGWESMLDKLLEEMPM